MAGVKTNDAFAFYDQWKKTKIKLPKWYIIQVTIYLTHIIFTCYRVGCWVVLYGENINKYQRSSWKFTFRPKVPKRPPYVTRCQKSRYLKKALFGRNWPWYLCGQTPGKHPDRSLLHMSGKFRTNVKKVYIFRTI